MSVLIIPRNVRYHKKGVYELLEGGTNCHYYNAGMWNEMLSKNEPSIVITAKKLTPENLPPLIKILYNV